MSRDEVVRSVRDFAARVLAPAAEAVDRSAAFPEDAWKRLAEHGLAGLAVPPRWGGLGVDLDTSLEAMEMVASACASTAWMLLAHQAAARAIVALGTDAQKDRYLPGLANGTLVGAALAGTEASGGSGPAGIRTTARREGDGFHLDGAKHFITLAGAADVYLVLARTSDVPGPEGLGCLIVERGDAGVSFGRREDTVGVRGVPIGAIHLEGCRVPGDRLLGPPGGGMAVLGVVGGAGLLGAGAAAIGIAQRAFDTALARVKERTVGGQKLASQPGVQGVLGEAATTLRGMRAWLQHASAWLAAGGRPPPVPVWMAKIEITRAALRAIDRSAALAGADGYTRGSPFDRLRRDATAFCIHWGNDEALADQIGRLVSSA